MKPFLASIRSIAASILAISMFLVAPSVSVPGFLAHAAETTTLTDTNGRLVLTFGSPASGFPLDSNIPSEAIRAVSKSGLH